MVTLESPAGTVGATIAAPPWGTSCDNGAARRASGRPSTVVRAARCRAVCAARRRRPAGRAGRGGHGRSRRQGGRGRAVRHRPRPPAEGQRAQGAGPDGGPGPDQRVRLVPPGREPQLEAGQHAGQQRQGLHALAALPAAAAAPRGGDPQPGDDRPVLLPGARLVQGQQAGRPDQPLRLGPADLRGLPVPGARLRRGGPQGRRAVVDEGARPERHDGGQPPALRGHQQRLAAPVDGAVRDRGDHRAAGLAAARDRPGAGPRGAPRPRGRLRRGGGAQLRDQQLPVVQPGGGADAPCRRPGSCRAVPGRRDAGVHRPCDPARRPRRSARRRLPGAPRPGRVDGHRRRVVGDRGRERFRAVGHHDRLCRGLRLRSLGLGQPGPAAARRDLLQRPRRPGQRHPARARRRRVAHPLLARRTAAAGHRPVGVPLRHDPQLRGVPGRAQRRAGRRGRAQPAATAAAHHPGRWPRHHHGRRPRLLRGDPHPHHRLRPRRGRRRGLGPAHLDEAGAGQPAVGPRP